MTGERERLLGMCLAGACREFSFRGPREEPLFSGIRPLKSADLLPFLSKPGVFLILGPEPELAVLHIGASQGPMGRSLWARLEAGPGGCYRWRWEERSDPPPSFAACLAFHQDWALIPYVRTFVAQQLSRDREPMEEGAPGGKTI